MKFNCSTKEKEERRKAKSRKKYERVSNWHKWFAWFPVHLSEEECRWLEFLERRSADSFYLYDCYPHSRDWYYRPKTK